MDFQPLGATGLIVSAAGLGTGGPSHVGVRTGRSEDESIAIIRAAIENGVNFIDTAEAYGTEPIVGKAIAGEPRDSLVISTKLSHWERSDADSVTAAIDERLRLLGTDYVDICHFHAVQLDAYDHVVDRFYPALVRAREAGKVRYIGLTEAFNPDPRHAMLERALRDDLWDVIMVGFNVLNQSARDRVLARTRASGVGVLDMFAVRLALSRPERLVDVINGLVSDGAITIDQLRDAGGTMEDPLGWVVRDSDADTLVEAAYRFVRHEPGIDVTLTGTGNLEHLLANITAIQMPPLPDDVVARLKQLFAAVDSVSGQ